MYASDGYARFRAAGASTSGGGSQGKALTPPPTSSSSEQRPPSAMPNMRSAPRLHTNGRYGGAMGFEISDGGVDLAPDELAKSLQPVACSARYDSANMARRDELLLPMQMQMPAQMSLPSAAFGLSNDASSGGRPPWTTTAPSATNFDANYSGYPSSSSLDDIGTGLPSVTTNNYLPPVAYRRGNGELDGFDDPREFHTNYRTPVNSYDLADGAYTPPSANTNTNNIQQHQHQHQQMRSNMQDQRQRLQQHQHQHPKHQRQQQQFAIRGGRLTTAGSSINTTPAFDPTMVLLARERERERNHRQLLDHHDMLDQKPSPPSSVSSAGAAWAREMDAFDQVRRIHSELQPPGPPGPAPASQGQSMAWQLNALPAHLRGPPIGQDHSPGSRIATPAATLQKSQRRGGAASTKRRMAGTAMAPPPQNGMMEPEMYSELEPQVPPTTSQRGTGQVPSGSRHHHHPQAMQMPPNNYEAMAMGKAQQLPQQRLPSEYQARGSPAALQRPHDQLAMMQQDPRTTKNQLPPPPPPPAARASAKKRKAAPPPPPPSAAAAASSKKRASTTTKRGAMAPQADEEVVRKRPSSSASTSASGKKQSNNNNSSAAKRRCGRKSMNYSSEQKRERNRAAVKKCRQRQALKYDYLKHKADVLASENRALSEMLVKNVELDDDKRNSLTRGIQMDILLKIKEIFTQSLPKDFVLDADSIWDLNSVLAVSMPSRCYYGIESIKDFWRTSLRMRNKGKIRSFWAWLFRLPPGDRFCEFTIEPFSQTSNLYFIHWTTKSSPPLSGSIVILFGHGHRVTLHVEIFGWLIWRYLLTNTPFPEPPLE